MSNSIAIFILVITLFICASVDERKRKADASFLQYVSLDTSRVKYTKLVYVPVNMPGKARSGVPALKTILKIRNTSLSDSIYVSRVEYYDKQGMLLKSFIDSVILVRPMATAEITVKSKEFKTSGDNFIVQWHADNAMQKPIIHAVSLGHENKMVTSDPGVIITNHQTETN